MSVSELQSNQLPPMTDTLTPDELYALARGWQPLMMRLMFLSDCLHDFNHKPDDETLRNRVRLMTEEVLKFQEIQNLGLTHLVE